MAKKKNSVERKPDLNEAANQAEIEARIKEMMELDDPVPTDKAPASNVEELIVSAPELPGAKKPISIPIIDHSDTDSSSEAVSVDSQDSEPQPPIDPEVMAAIEQANKQLMGSAGDNEESISQESPEDQDKNEPAQAEEITKTAPEISDLSDMESDESGSEEDSKSLEELWAEDSQTDTKEVDPVDEIEDVSPEKADLISQEEVGLKEKPLKHLDSIIPKTKVSETIESSSTAKAVDDIIATDADELLRIEDEKLATAEPVSVQQTVHRKHKSVLNTKTLFRITVIVALALMIGAILNPKSRYYLLNTAGIRSQASLKVYDASTLQPLKDVKVTIGDAEEHTDADGKVHFTKVKLGQSKIVIEKRAFAAINLDHVIGWGSNPLDDVSLTPTGSQYVFIVTDFLSGKPVSKVEAVSKEASAISNEKGEIKLTIDQKDNSSREVSLIGEGYRIETISLNLDQKEATPIRLVPARKHVFITKRTGKYDVYKIDIDGKNEKLILPGSGSEREDMVLVSHPTEEVAAVVSTKDNKRNSEGFLLSTLTVMNLQEETVKSVVTSERVQIIDWVGSRIVYVQIKQGASGDSPDRHKLVSYDYKSGEFKELASSNYFNDVLVAQNQVYVAPSSTYSQSTGASMVRINADGTSKQTIINKEVWNIFRTSYEKLTFAVGQDWYELKLGENQAGKISGEPPTQTSRIYVDSADRSKALWVDTRDGKGVLLAYKSDTKQDDLIRAQAGLKMPVRWLTNNTVVYRIHTQSETADYALNISGGEPVKIKDVTNTSGVNTWYYY